MPDDPAERLAIARRYVADRCLYGVDINPMAVEMAKLSLWLITLQRDRPFTFLDHALKCGDSLLGRQFVKQIENFSLRARRHGQVTFGYSQPVPLRRRSLRQTPRTGRPALQRPHPDRNQEPPARRSRSRDRQGQGARRLPHRL